MMDSEVGVATEERLGNDLDSVIGEAAEALIGLQREDGHWVFELEADATIPAEYILLRHFLGDPDPALEAQLAAYLRRIMCADGGWALFYGGAFDMSATVKAYFALKIVGDDPEAPHMARSRTAVLARGGAARANVFTRITLALFGQVPWRAVPVMPVEIMLLPRWFPFHLEKVSYWSRTVIAPLLVLMAKRPKAANPRGVDIAELFTMPPDEERHYLVNASGTLIGRLFLWVDTILRPIETLLARGRRDRAIDRAMAFIGERLNGLDGLGAIFPAMANAVMAMASLGYGPEHADRKTAMEAIDRLLVRRHGEAYCQPCVSPVWDTALTMYALAEAGSPGSGAAAARAAAWLRTRQVTDIVGDWASRRPDVRPGGWAFQYANPHYPDIDDTAAVVMALDRVAATSMSEARGKSNGNAANVDDAIARGEEWLMGMQSRNGGWGSFDADNTHYYLNTIPFADHGALLDPPTADVTARCVSALCQLGYGADHPAVARGLKFLTREQETNGSWFGRWGNNYIYGTWAALSAFRAAGEDAQAPHIRRAVRFLEECQRQDGGWGEDGTTYMQGHAGEAEISTASQTAWALLALMAAGEVDSIAVERGINWLLQAPREGAEWEEPWYTAVGFPRIFYLRYHGYRQYFPLWALARYRNLLGKAPPPALGM